MNADQELRRLLLRYGIREESESGEQFLAYLGLLEKWNRRINLVSSTSWDILGPLFEEGIWAGQRYPKRDVRHLDIGSGAGFPALFLKLQNPHMKLRMVESQTRRYVFLETAGQALALKNASVSNCTLDAYLQGESANEGWDCVSWKAIKLSRRDYSRLVTRASGGTEFWVFQGRDLPVEGGEIHPDLRQTLREAIPGKSAWQLVIYQKQP